MTTNTNSNNQTTLYIRRAETSHTASYIIDTFKKLNIGTASDVVFIRKVSESGQEYNGAVVTFSEWADTTEASKLLAQINLNADATVKIIHQANGHKFWLVSKHRVQQPQSQAIWQDTSACSVGDLQYIIQQMNHRLFKQDQELQLLREKQLEYEILHMRLALTNEDLRCELKEKEGIILEQQDKMVCMAIDMARKEGECVALMETVNEERSILDLIQSQALDMRNLLSSSYIPNTSKMTMEELID